MTAGAGLRDFIVAFGLLLVFEGVVYTLAPGLMKSLFDQMRRADESVLRWSGLLALVAGVALVWAVRG
jgi:uncharacterized protein